MARAVLVGISAGLAAALLFLAPVSGTLLAFPLFALTGLPVALAGLGWSVFAGVVAGAAGAGLVAALAGWTSAAIFTLVFAVPLTWLTRLAVLSRPVDAAVAEGEREWYPPGRMLFHAAVVVAIGLVAVGIVIGFDPQTLVREITLRFSQWLASADNTGGAPTPAQIEPFVRVNVALLPFTVAIVTLVIVVADLWLAALVAWASGRLARPRDDIWAVALPGRILAGLAAAALLAFVPGNVGHVAAVFAGALGTAVALVGLAVVHSLTAGMTGRAALLSVTYALVSVSGLPLVLFAVIGIGETVFHLRERHAGGGNRS